MSTRQHNYREGLFKHVYLHPLYSVFSLCARGTSCCTLLPQKHTTVTHPALHPALTKHSVTVSETSLSTFASSCMKEKKKKEKKKSVNVIHTTGITDHNTRAMKAGRLFTFTFSTDDDTES